MFSISMDKKSDKIGHSSHNLEEKLTKPRKGGGWGRKNIYLFNQVIVAKCLLRFLFNAGFGDWY